MKGIWTHETLLLLLALWLLSFLREVGLIVGPICFGAALAFGLFALLGDDALLIVILLGLYDLIRPRLVKREEPFPEFCNCEFDSDFTRRRR